MFSRRNLLKTVGSGFGYLAFSALAHEQSCLVVGDDKKPAPQKLHFPAHAKRVIFLCMEGGPSHVDTFDYKPKLAEDSGKQPATRQRGFGRGKLLGPQADFKQRGESGLWISDLFPEVSKHADELCVLNGMHTDLPNHAQAFLQMHCGLFQFTRPSLGSWVLYGLGSGNQDLPGFITINPPSTNGGSANYASSFLPASYQGTRINSRGFGEMVSNLKNRNRDKDSQRIQLDFTQQLNRNTSRSLGDDAQVEGLISSFEMAFRMQSEMPGVLDLDKESRETLSLYGISGSGGGRQRRGFGGGFGGGSDGETDNFGKQCLLARRLVESGVRFVEVTMRGWDHHRNLSEALPSNCQSVDKPIAGLLADLKRRDMLKDTLVIWGGEFGRTPHAQGDGRDHNNKGYSMWMAGGGCKGGFKYGATDDYGYEAVEGRTHIHDWHATVLHLLGLDHEKLTYRYGGRDIRLTDVKGRVVKEIIGA